MNAQSRGQAILEQRTRPEAPEQRTVDVDVQNLEARGHTVHGYAAVYGVESEDLGGFRERIAPGAFANVLDSDVRALLNHDPNIVLGRTKSGTLRLADDERGLRFEVDLPESRSDLREAVARGDLDGASFRFKVGEEEWDGDLRTVKSVEELRDITLATYPAYPTASVELRSKPKDDPAKREPTNGGGLVIRDRSRLRVEDRTEHGGSDVEERVSEALRNVRKGEARSLTVSGDTPIAPPELSTFLFEKLRASSVALQSGIVVIATDRESIQWPKLDADVAPGFYDETDTITPGDPGFDTLTATPKKIAHIVEASNEVIDDSDPSVVDVLNAHLATMLGLKLDAAIFEGAGGTNPATIEGLANVAGTQSGDAPTDYDAFVNAVGLLRAANVPEPYVAVGPPEVWTSLSLLKNGTLDEQLAPPREMPQVFTTTQTVENVYVYSPSQVVLVRRQDATIELDRSRLFNQDMSEVRGKLRADLLAPNPEAVVVLPIGS